ncbi:MAG: hypothetical protein U0797_25205 [Gemmataceae bacterium]
MDTVLSPEYQTSTRERPSEVITVSSGAVIMATNWPSRLTAISRT